MVICKVVKLGSPFSCFTHAIGERKRVQGRREFRGWSKVQFVYSRTKLDNKGLYSNYLTYTVKFRQHSSLKWKAINTPQALLRSFCSRFCLMDYCLELLSTPEAKPWICYEHEVDRTLCHNKTYRRYDKKEKHINLTLRAFLFLDFLQHTGFEVMFTVLFHEVIPSVNIRLRFH